MSCPFFSPTASFNLPHIHTFIHTAEICACFCFFFLFVLGIFLGISHFSCLCGSQSLTRSLASQLPYFMNELTLADLDMGTCLPQVLSASKPTLDRRGTVLLHFSASLSCCIVFTHKSLRPRSHLLHYSLSSLL